MKGKGDGVHDKSDERREHPNLGDIFSRKKVSELTMTGPSLFLVESLFPLRQAGPPSVVI
jgi:hypothetical protein